MSQAVATQEQANYWRNQLSAMEPQFQRALPAHIPVERFVRAAETAIMRDAELLSCDRKSLFQAIMQCAESGLMPNGRDAALVRFKAQVQYIPMIGGILRLMRNTGEVQSIVAEVVYENDHFEYRLGDDPKISHQPALANRGKMIAAYAILQTKDGGVYREIMGAGEIEAVKKISRAKNGPWDGPFEPEMWRKTVLRRLAKRCPLSSDTLMDLTSRDDNLYDLSAVQQPPTRIEQIREALTGRPEPSHDKIVADAAEIEDVQDAEFEGVEDAAPQPEPSNTPAVEPEAEPNTEAVFSKPEEAAKELQSIVKIATRVDAIEGYLAGWKDMVRSSFGEKIALQTIAAGQKVANQRKLEIQKAEASR